MYINKNNLFQGGTIIMANVLTLDQTPIPQNYRTICETIGWEVTPEDCIHWAKTIVAGVSDALGQHKDKNAPVVIVIQDLKGNKIIYACVKYIKAEDDEAAEGNWTYYWSWDVSSIPEDAIIHTLDQDKVREIVSRRGHDICRITLTDMTFVSQLSIFFFNLLHDYLDHQAVEEAQTFTVELEGYFEASVEVINGKKNYSFLPKGEMKTLIKDDSAQ